MDFKNAKCLIAYFSRKGENYVGGKIVSLPVGNTEIFARAIQGMTGGFLFRIESVDAYPAGYTETTRVAQKELNANARPALTGHVEDFDSYDVIFLGYPNWWGTMPMPVLTFLEQYNFSGKTIVPFCTHEGSGFGRSISDIKKVCPEATVLDASGLSARGSSADMAHSLVLEWLQKLGIQD
jgi:flavodoxin